MAMIDATDPAGEPTTGLIWRCPTLKEVFQRPLPQLGLGDRALTRAVSFYLMPRFTAVSGLEHVACEADPFILALNHSTRFEAVAIPALLLYHRGGRRVHFLADWNFQMIPGIGLLYRRSGAIVITRKSARPRFLNALKPLYAHAETSLDRARAHLDTGRSVGIFLEGTVNRDSERLLRGRLGAARLSLEASAPVVPGGIRITEGTSDRTRIEVHFGAALHPGPRNGCNVTGHDVRRWHATIMTEIARLSGKSWEPLSQEHRHGTP